MKWLGLIYFVTGFIIATTITLLFLFYLRIQPYYDIQDILLSSAGSFLHNLHKPRNAAYRTDPRVANPGLWFHKTAAVGVRIYGKIITPIFFVGFLVWTKLAMAWDPQAESIQHVGEWSTPVGIALAFLGAVVGKYTPNLMERVRRYMSRRKFVREEKTVEGVIESWRYVRDVPGGPIEEIVIFRDV